MSTGPCWPFGCAFAVSDRYYGKALCRIARESILRGPVRRLPSSGWQSLNTAPQLTCSPVHQGLILGGIGLAPFIYLYGGSMNFPPLTSAQASLPSVIGPVLQEDQ